MPRPMMRTQAERRNRDSNCPSLCLKRLCRTPFSWGGYERLSRSKLSRLLFSPWDRLVMCCSLVLCIMQLCQIAPCTIAAYVPEMWSVYSMHVYSCHLLPLPSPPALIAPDRPDLQTMTMPSICWLPSATKCTPTMCRYCRCVSYWPRKATTQPACMQECFPSSYPLTRIQSPIECHQRKS